MSELEYSKETNYGDFFTVINIVVMILFLIGLFIMAKSTSHSLKEYLPH